MEIVCIVNFVIYSFSQGQKQSSLGTFTKCLLKRSFLYLRPLENQNWSVENFSKHTSPQLVVHLSPRYRHVTLVSGSPTLTAVN